jgi:hypothetical protein
MWGSFSDGASAGADAAGAAGGRFGATGFPTDPTMATAWSKAGAYPAITSLPDWYMIAVAWLAPSESFIRQDSYAPGGWSMPPVEAS